MSRTSNSLKNISTQLLTTIVIALLGFVTRKAFVDSLGTEYLGLNGLLSNVLGMLSLVEGGIGTSIVYNLYKPLAIRDEKQIIALVQLYRKIYRYISLAVFVLALLLFPFLDVFIKGGENLSYVSVVYFIFVANTLVGYYMADKWSLINADQKQYRLAGYNITYQILMYLVKIAILVYFKNYIAYLIVELFFGIGYNFFIIRKINSFYPFLRTKQHYGVDKDTKGNIITNVKALFFHSLGGYLLHGTDNIIISSFVSISLVGIYSNFRLLVIQFISLSHAFFVGVKESVGNLVATESKEHQFEVFKTLYFLNFVITSGVVVILYNTLNPFVSWWLGTEYTTNESSIIAICVLFYVDEIRSSIMMYKVVSGLFVPDKYVVFITAIINLAVSISLVKQYELVGVLFGSIISLLLTASWNWPRIVYKYVFLRPLRHYFYYYFLYISITVLCSWGSREINDIYFYCQGRYSIVSIVCRAFLSITLLLTINTLLFYKTKEYQAILRLVILKIRK